MIVEENKKLHMRFLNIEFGTKCNLKCRHCYMGDLPDLAIKPEYVDAVLDNVYELDELWLSGGEITLYLDHVEMILRKVLNAKIKVNYFGIVTNGVIKSERLTEIFEKFRLTTTFPNDANFRISVDKFHSEQSGISEEKMNEVVKWYQERVGGKVLENRLDNAWLFLVGRARNLSSSELKNFKNVAVKKDTKCKVYKISFKPLCEGEKNACGYGCVKNCVSSHLNLAADGYLYANYEESYDSKDRRNFSVCHIMERPVFDALKEWNTACEKGSGTAFVKVKEDTVEFHFFLMQAAISYFKIEIANAYEKNDIKKLEECAEVFDYCIEKWNDYLTDNAIKESIHTYMIRSNIDALMDVYKEAYVDAMLPVFMRDKEIRKTILSGLRGKKEFDELMRNVFLSYATKDLDSYCKDFDAVIECLDSDSELPSLEDIKKDS